METQVNASSESAAHTVSALAPPGVSGNAKQSVPASVRGLQYAYEPPLPPELEVDEELPPVHAPPIAEQRTHCD